MIFIISIILGLVVAGLADLLANIGRLWRFCTIAFLSSIFIYFAYSIATLRVRMREQQNIERVSESAGINRLGIDNERVLQRKPSQ